MGNRAVICFDEYDDEAIGIYVHWNGGRDSIEAFLQATREVMQGRLGDAQYCRARLMQVIGTGIPGNLSFGLDKCKHLDTTGDNGVYIVDSKTMEIIGRENYDYEEQAKHNVDEFAAAIIKGIRAGADAFETA